MGIFDEFVQGVNREISRVQSRSQEMLQAYNLNSRVRSLEGQRTAILIEIGRMVFDKYQRHLEVSEDSLRDKSNQIVELEHQITVLKAELDAIHAQSDPNTSASQKADYKAGYTTTPGFTCPHCQAPANVDKGFCPACGGSLKETPKDGNGSQSS